MDVGIKLAELGRSEEVIRILRRNWEDAEGKMGRSSEGAEYRAGP